MSSCTAQVFFEHKGCCSYTFLGCSVAARGLHRHCIFPAADHVHDLVVDYVSRLASIVFLRLFEFFANFYDRCRRDHYAKLDGLWASARLLYPYASSSTTSSPPPSSLLRQLHLLQQPRAASASPSAFCTTTAFETSAGPLHSATWLCAPFYVRYWQHWQTRYLPRPWRFDGIILASSSTHHRFRLLRLRATTVLRPLVRQRLYVRLPLHRLPRHLPRSLLLQAWRY